MTIEKTIEQWWPQLRRESREWLMKNNGDVVRADIAAEIVRAGGTTVHDSMGHDDGSASVHLTDEEVDWIEAVANGETPG